MKKISLLRRAFWQGYSKRLMKELGYSVNEEERFVKSLFTNFWKKFNQKDEEGRAKAKSMVAVGQVMFLLVFTSAVGFGVCIQGFRISHNTTIRYKTEKYLKIT